MTNIIVILQAVTPWIGFATSVLFYACPICLIYLIHNKKQSIKDSSCVGILASLINCTLWFTWGLGFFIMKIHDAFDPIDFCNLIGMMLSLIYLTVYFYYYAKGFNWYLVFYLFSLYDITFEIMYFEIEFGTNDNNSKNTAGEIVIQWLAAVFNIIMYLTPGMNIIEIFKTKNHHMISIIGSILGVVNSSAWLFWGIVSSKNNSLLHVIVTNAIALALCIVQVFVYFYYRKYNADHNIFIGNDSYPQLNENIQQDIGITDDNNKNNDNEEEEEEEENDDEEEQNKPNNDNNPAIFDI